MKNPSTETTYPDKSVAKVSFLLIEHVAGADEKATHRGILQDVEIVQRDVGEKEVRLKGERLLLTQLKALSFKHFKIDKEAPLTSTRTAIMSCLQ